MTIEAGVVINIQNEVIHWHLPLERTAGSLPDSKDLWEILWENKENLLGVAHSHPGRGVPGPSYEDVTTFAAVEAALGKRLDWWITSANKLVVVRWKGPGRLQYEATNIDENFSWLPKLREHSNYNVEVQNGRSEYHPGQ